MTIEEMKRRKIEKGYSFATLSGLSGVPVSTIQKIWGGTTSAPRQATLEALERVLLNPLAGKKQGEFTIEDFQEYSGGIGGKLELSGGQILGLEGNYAYRTDGDEKPMVSEGIREYKRSESGSYTISDLIREQERRNVELIHGVFYEMAAPTGVHQSIEIEVILQLRSHVTGLGRNCLVTGPRNVRLDMTDNASMYEPDIVVLCDGTKDKNTVIEGAPDLLIEILSPLTALKDKTIKMRDYEAGGVREVWLINPANRQIITHDFEHGDRVGLYGFEDQVPVLISKGVCRIDFREISRNLEKTYGPDWN